MFYFVTGMLFVSEDELISFIMVSSIIIHLTHVLHIIGQQLIYLILILFNHFFANTGNHFLEDDQVSGTTPAHRTH